MAPPQKLPTRWNAAVAAALVLLLLLVSPSAAIYCEEDDCYDLLGVSQAANASEIKRAYYKLSLKHHPDKNPDPESKKLFVKIANAYEILKDEATRGQYDYAIAHPEEVFYNAARYYHAYYGYPLGYSWASSDYVCDTRLVILGLLLIMSVFQYLNQQPTYNQTVEMVKKTPAYKNRLRALEFERSGGITSKKKNNKQMDKKIEEDLSMELELDIKGAQKPSVWELLGVRIIFLPYNLSKVKHAPYSLEDAGYLTMRALRAPLDVWATMDEPTKDDLIHRRLWEKSNLERYLTEVRKDSKRRR